MRDLAELVAGWLYALRITSGPQWVLRVGVLACGMVAAALGWLWFPMILSTALLVAGSVMTLAATVRPDSGAALGVVAVVAIMWLAGGADARWWQWLTVAAVVAGFHLVTALAAAGPSYAAITARAARRMAVGVVGFVGVSAGAGLAVVALSGVPSSLLGPAWVAAGVAAVAGGTVVAVAALRRGTP